MITQKTIERFFRNECTREEREAVLLYIKANPDEFGKYLTESDWENFEVTETIDADLSRKIYETVRRQTVEKRSRLKLFVKIGVAASALLMVACGWMYFRDKTEEPSFARKEKSLVESIGIVAREEVNETAKEKKIKLEDGTIIMLAIKSKINYELPFVNSRNIRLGGKADFIVAKDKTKPFTVTSGAIATTAVGTQFTVTAYQAAGKLMVRLQEGRVVIKPVQSGNWRMKKEVFLSPGDEFIYSDRSMAIIRSFRKKQQASDSDELVHDNPILPKIEKGSWYMFNNQKLGQVFDQLAFTYNVKIVYDKNEVQNKYFIGRFNKSDSLDVILKYIIDLNKLKIQKTDNIYYINK